MPFTLSHTAVVLPFARPLVRWRLLSAVIIGAMVPDFGLFLPWRMYRIETHSAMGLLTFCLPVGLICYWIFQAVIKTPILEVLPEGAHARWRPYASPARLGSLLQWVLAAIGVLAGAVTHLVWDAFTHDGARGVRMIPWLEDPIVDIGSHHMVGVRLMQDVSSLIGLLVVALWIWYALRRGHEQAVNDRVLRRPERRAWMAIYLGGAVMFTGLWFVLARWLEPGMRPGHSIIMLIGTLSIATLRGLASSLLLTSLVLNERLRALKAMRAAQPPPA